MAVSVAQFRANFPAFTSATAYPDASVNFWLTWAYLFLSPQRWGKALDLGAQLFVAHNVTLDYLGASEGANGAPSGMATGPIVSKTVGELTITYEVTSGVNEDDQHWALTFYGTRFVKLARQFGSGPVQIGFGVTPIGQGGGAVGFPMGQPWTGPWFENWTQ